MDSWPRSRDTMTVSVPLATDADGYLGRECPQPACEGYFKATPETGIDGNRSCYCPYCGHLAPHDHFYTKDQIAYARSVALNQFSQALVRSLKRNEFSHRPRGGLFSVSLKVTGHPYPIRHYREDQLETEIVCDECALRYAIYGVFAYCPDCGKHNSRQILDKNLELAAKELALAATAERDLAEYLINDALENEVAAFDGFGRETCRVYATKAVDPSKAQGIGFQNLPKARRRVQDLFGVDIAGAVTAPEWDAACRSFQKRHLLAHSMGVVDQAYLAATQDPRAVVGRKIVVAAGEVAALDGILKALASDLVDKLRTLP